MAVGDNEIVELIVEFNLPDGSIGQNHFTFQAEFDAAQTDATVMTALEVWAENAYANLVSQIPTTVTFNQAPANILTWHSTEYKWYKSYEIGQCTPDVSFLNATDELPNQVSAFLTYVTIRPKTRGRTVLPPFGESAQDAGDLLSSHLAAVVAFGADAISDITISAGNFLRRVVVRSAAETVYNIGSAIVTSLLGTQRRRRPGYGA